MAMSTDGDESPEHVRKQRLRMRNGEAALTFLELHGRQLLTYFETVGGQQAIGAGLGDAWGTLEIVLKDCGIINELPRSAHPVDPTGDSAGETLASLRDKVAEIDLSFYDGYIKRSFDRLESEVDSLPKGPQAMHRMAITLRDMFHEQEQLYNVLQIQVAGFHVFPFTLTPSQRKERSDKRKRHEIIMERLVNLMQSTSSAMSHAVVLSAYEP